MCLLAVVVKCFGEVGGRIRFIMAGGSHNFIHSILTHEISTPTALASHFCGSAHAIQNAIKTRTSIDTTAAASIMINIDRINGR